MLDLSISELTTLIGGQLALGTMGPIGGDLEPVGQIVTDVSDVRPGTLYWGLEREPGKRARGAEEALYRSAQGVVVAGRHIEPWAGRFSIRVEDAWWALGKFVRWLRTRQHGLSRDDLGGSIGKAILHRTTDHSPGASRFASCAYDASINDISLALDVAQTKSERRCASIGYQCRGSLNQPADFPLVLGRDYRY